MNSPRNIIAIDLGNSSGRVVLGQWNGGTGILRQIYRFPNEPNEENWHVVWDTERIWRETLQGLRIAAIESGGRVESIGLDCSERLLSRSRAMNLNITNEGGVGDTIRFLRNVIGLWLLQEALREWNEKGMEVSAAELAEQNMTAPLDGLWFDVSEAKDFLAPGNMIGRINAALSAQGFPEQRRKTALAGIIFRSLAKRYAEVIKTIRICTGKRIERLCIIGGGVKNEALNRLAGAATGLEIVKGPSEATLAGNVAVQISALENARTLEDIQGIASRLTYAE